MNIKTKLVLGSAITILAAAGLAIALHHASASPALAVSANSFSAPKPIVALPSIALAPNSVAPPTAKPVVPSSSPPAVAATTAVGAVPSAALQNNMHQIGITNVAYMFEGNNLQTLMAQPGDTAHTAAFELARAQYLNMASVYFVPGDPKAPNPLPKVVILGNPTDPTDPLPMNPAFANATLSVEMAVNIPPNAAAKTTPMAWSRGLRDDGTWAPDSPFGGKGGYVTYLDGHVDWMDKFSTVAYGTNVPTANIHEALPPGAVILSAEPAKTGH